MIVSRLVGLALPWLPVPILLVPLVAASAWAGGLEHCGNPHLYVLISWCYESIAPEILELPGDAQVLVVAGFAIVGARRLRAWSR